MSQEIVQVNSFLRGYHEYVTEWEPRLGDFYSLMRAEPNNIKDPNAVSVAGAKKKKRSDDSTMERSQSRETSKESWCRIGLEVPGEYRFESDSFSCWLQRKLEKEKFNVCSDRPTTEKCNGL